MVASVNQSEAQKFPTVDLIQLADSELSRMMREYPNEVKAGRMSPKEMVDTISKQKEIWQHLVRFYKTEVSMSTVVSALAPEAEEALAPETGWVIVRYTGPTLIYLVRPSLLGGSYATEWSYDNLQALRFARKEDAETVKDGLCLPNAKVEEHTWG
jgi:hypothetical protein